MSDRGDEVERLTDLLVERALSEGDERLAEPHCAAALQRGARRRARWLVRSGRPADPLISRATVELAAEALAGCLALRAREIIAKRRLAGTLDPSVADCLEESLAKHWAEIDLNDPSAWVDRAALEERDRRRCPYGVRDEDHRSLLAHLLELVYQSADVAAFASRLTGDANDRDEACQRAALGIYDRFLKADRLAEPSPVVAPGKEAAYVRTAVKHAFLDVVGRNARIRSPLGPDDLPPFTAEPPAVDPGPDAEAMAMVELQGLAKKIRDRSYAAPTILGKAYEQQWNRVPRGRGSELISRRFSVAVLFAARQRRSEQLVAPQLVPALRGRPDADDAVWLREPVNDALRQMDPQWRAQYGERLPSEDDRPGVGRGTEAGDYQFLLRECRGHVDRRRPPDPAGERSARERGVGGLLRLVYGDLVTNAFSEAVE